MNDKELEKEIRKMNEELKGLADSWEKTGMPTNIEDATEKVETFITWLEKNRPNLAKKREQLKKQFPQLTVMEDRV